MREVVNDVLMVYSFFTCPTDFLGTSFLYTRIATYSFDRR